MIILVCGGRTYGEAIYSLNASPEEIIKAKAKALNQRALLSSTLSQLNPELIIHGNARGADSLAGQWAALNKITQIAYPANWKRNGKSAGPIRNQLMLDEALPALVLAFPGGTGTADMIARAMKQGFKTRIIIE